MQATGNDYIYINTSAYTIENPEETAKRWSVYHTGIGSDGLVLIGASEKADFSMRIFNADGSEAKMCGNASRCIGKYVYEKGLTDKTDIALETLSGIRPLKLHLNNHHKVTAVTVDMGTPLLGKTEKGDKLVSDPVKAKGINYIATSISMGNPHLVIFTDDVEKADLERIGPLLENHPLFPDRTNVEFAQILDRKNIRMRVWERGSGITQACGTGACATAVAACINGKSEREVTIRMDGGTLRIDWDASSGKVFMTGDAVTIFEGEIEI